MLYQFDDISICTERRELHRGDAIAAVQPQVLDVLICLIENRGRIVSRDELIELVWHGRIVSESTLDSRINAARKAVGDSGREQRLIRTARGAGFRFIGAVDRRGTSSTDSNFVGTGEDVLTSHAIAVLPFANLTGDLDQQYFVDGLTEDIIASLSAWRTFPVVARGSAFATVAGDVRHIGSELNAHYVLEGSVRFANGRIRVVVELVDAHSGHQVWGDRIEREVADTFQLQDEITQRVVTSLKPQLRKSEQRISLARSESKLGAWDYYQRGWARLDEDTKSGNEQARDLFSRAIAIDTEHAQAFSSISIAHQRDLLLGFARSPPHSVSEAVAAAERALSIDAASSRLHSTLGNALRVAGRFDDAFVHLEKAVSIDPTNANASVALGYAQVLVGVPEAGLSRITSAVDIGLTEEWVTSKLSLALLSVDEYFGAAKAARQAINDRPRRPGPHVLLAIALAHQGALEEARLAFHNCERLFPGFAAEWTPGFRDTQVNQHLLAGLRISGLRE